MSPVFPELRQNLTEHIRFGDGSIDVRDYDFIVPVPEVDGSFAATCPLVLSGYTEGDIIRPLPQLQAGYLVRRQAEGLLVGVTGRRRRALCLHMLSGCQSGCHGVQLFSLIITGPLCCFLPEGEKTVKREGSKQNLDKSKQGRKTSETGLTEFKNIYVKKALL